MKLKQILSEIQKMRDEFGTGFGEIKIVEREGEVKFVNYNINFKVEDGRLIPCENIK